MPRPRSRALATLAALTLTASLAWAAGLPAPVAADAAATSPGPDTAATSRLASDAAPPADASESLAFTLTPAEELLKDLIDRSREAVDLDPVPVDPALARVARAYAEAIVADGVFSHIAKDGATPADRLRRAGIRFLAVYENLAGAPSVADAHAALMKSPGHRANILRQGLTAMGLAYVPGGPYGGVAVELFVVTPGGSEARPAPASSAASSGDAQGEAGR